MSDTAPDPDAFTWPPWITAADAEALEQLAAAGVGEGELDEPEALHVPADLVELYEVLEWRRAVEAQEGGES